MTVNAIFVPDWRGGNPYQELLAKALASNDVRVDFSDCPPGILPLQRIINNRSGSILIHLHWANQLFAPLFWNRSFLKKTLRLGLLALDILLCRARGVQVIWTVHNFHSHETQDVELEIKAQRLLAKCVSQVIVHSTGALAALRDEWGSAGLEHQHVSVIRHGNYVGCYPTDESLAARLRANWRAGDTSKVILFLGALRRYKGLEQLLEVFGRTSDPNLRLVIAGRPQTQELADHLAHCASKDARIIIKLEFVPESEVGAYYKAADLIALPFQKTLTSGSAILAMSMGRTILLPSHAKLLDLGSDDLLLYFSSNEELQQHLDSIDTAALRDRGRRCGEAALAWNWSAIGAQTAAVYRGTGTIAL